MTQADDYAKEIKKIDAEIANDPANTTLIERRQELLEQQRDMIKSAEDEKSAIKDLVSDAYSALSDALKKIADNYLNVLQAQKDLYDYENTISEKTSNIASLRKQIDALSGDQSEETQSKLQQLQVSLTDAEKDLRETEWTRELQDISELTQSMQDDLSEWINQRLDDLDGLVQEVIAQTNTNADTISKVIETETGNVGYTLSKSLTDVLNADTNNGFNMVNFYDKTFPNEMTTTRNSIDAIKNLLQAMKDAADKKAQEEIKKQQAAQQKISSTPSTPSSSSSSNSGSSSSGGSYSSSGSSVKWGSWFIHKADSYPKSKLNKENSITDRLKYFSIASDFNNRRSYYAAMGLGSASSYKGSASQNRNMIAEMKKHGFKQGGTIGKLISGTGEDGFVLARTGEEILSKEKISLLKDALQYIPQKDGRYEARITIGDKRKCFYGRTKTEVKNKAKDYLLKIENGYKEPQKIIFNDYIEYWLKKYKYTRIEPSSYTRLYRTYECQIKPNIGTKYIGSITTKDIQRFIDEFANPTKKNTKALAKSGLKKLIQLLRPCMERAVSEGIIQNNP